MHTHAQTQASNAYVSQNKDNFIILIYKRWFLYLNRWYSIMLKMGTVVSGLEKSSYKSFALEADLSVWLLGKTGRMI